MKTKTSVIPLQPVEQLTEEHWALTSQFARSKKGVCIGIGGDWQQISLYHF